MQNIKQYKSIFAILGVLLLLFFSICISFFVLSVRATTNVTIENSGSRLNAKSDSTPTSYQWLISDTVDGTYSPIYGANQQYYDIKAEDEGKYIKVSADSSESETVGPIGKLIVMDIGKSSITLGATYSGKDSDGNAVSGSHLSSNIYVITHRENGEKTTNNIVFDGHHKNAPFNVTLDNVNMGATPKKHNQDPGNSGVDTPTGGQITINALQSSIKKVTLVLKGENQVRNITYYNSGDTTTPQTVDSYLKITDINGDGAAGDGVDGGSLYIPYKIETEAEIDAFVATKTNYNHWNAGIGGIDSQSLVQNLHIAGGKIQVVTTLGDNCTAIGAGGNGYCEMLISGGEVIAHCNGTGAAIGGGIGWQAAGGKSDVTITGGKVYAKNHSEIASGGELVGGVAIGSGSSFHKAGSEGIVTISGGYVEAYGTFGNGIGGGNSSTSVGGKATISITGGTVIASSIGGGDSKSGVGGSATVVVSGTADVTLTKGIGGGKSSSGNGGAATITVESGTINVAGSIGGGEGGKTGNGGDATVNIYGGNLTAASIGGGTGSVGGHGGAAIVKVTGGFIETGSIGGGKTNNPSGNLGYAKATISGGDIAGQFLMAAGGTEACTFTMTGGTLHGVYTADTSKFNYAQQNGAAVYMDDPNGVVSISGGTIKDCSAVNGGAIYMSDGTCTISGNAVIESCVASENGGAVYMGGGTLAVTGGSIKNNSAEQNGGAVYLGGGSMTVYSGEISANTAKDSGGAAFIDGGNVKVAGGSITNNTAANNGGGVAVNNGNFNMVGGAVDGNTSVDGSGGGIYVSAPEGSSVPVQVGVYSGSVSSNISGLNGGALAVVGVENGTRQINVQIGVNKEHFERNGTEVTTVACDHDHIDMVDNEVLSCPQVNSNSATASGGAIFVTGSVNTTLDIFCLTEIGSSAGGENGQSNFMKVEGGKVSVTTSDSYTIDTQNSRFGNTEIKNTVYVTGGQMDLWGAMTNPRIEDIITVDITKEGDYFEDHRAHDGYYKVIYFENFTDPLTGITTGQYKEYEIPTEENDDGNPNTGANPIVISGSIYNHPGYTISGWHTYKDIDKDPDGNHNHPQGECNCDPKDMAAGWYEVGESYVLDGNPIGDLIIYAIWQANGYRVVFNPNCTDYTGSMPEDMAFQYNVAQKIPKNQYHRDGYNFLGWSQDDPNGTAKYSDEQEVVNLTTKKGDIVTLYAVWGVCLHTDTEKYIYSVIDGGATLKRECPCGAYSETVRLVAPDAVYSYDEVSGRPVEHPVNVIYSSASWHPDVVYSSGSVPAFAGSYTASVSGGGKTASVIYTVEKAEQAAPYKPTYSAEIQDGKSTLKINPVEDSYWKAKDPSYDSVPEYRVVYYDYGVEYAVDWTPLEQGKSTVDFELNVVLTSYYIQVRYSEGTNYRASPVSNADSVYFFVGNVQLYVDCGEGVRHTATEAKKGSLENGIKIEIEVLDGYYFPTEYELIFKAEPSGAVLTEKNKYSEYSITNIGNGNVLRLTIPAAKKRPILIGAVTEKQVFGRVSEDSANISRDSAYTAYFEIRNLQSEYNGNTSDTAPKFVFSTPLPSKTKLIMIDKVNNVYYALTLSSSKSEILLCDFIRMGTQNTKFVSSEGDHKLQLIVDFSATDDIASGDKVDTKLSLTRSGGTDSYESINQTVTTVLNDEAEFNLETGAATVQDDVVVSYVFRPSNGVTSKWDNRSSALVFKPKTTLPADARISFNDGNRTVIVYPNRNGEFAATVSQITSGYIRPVLLSDYFSETAQSYNFDVRWMISNSLADDSPTNGTQVAEHIATLVGQKKNSVSVKIKGDKKEFESRSSFEVNVLLEDVEPHYEVKATLMRKNANGGYASTGWTSKILPTADGYSRDNLLEVILAGQTAGSYSLCVTVESGLETFAEVNYYFIVI